MDAVEWKHMRHRMHSILLRRSRTHKWCSRCVFSTQRLVHDALSHRLAIALELDHGGERRGGEEGKGAKRAVFGRVWRKSTRIERVRRRMRRECKGCAATMRVRGGGEYEGSAGRLLRQAKQGGSTTTVSVKSRCTSPLIAAHPLVPDHRLQACRMSIGRWRG